MPGEAAAALAVGVLLAACHALENTTAAWSALGPPVAAAVRSHFNDCPDSHSQFCFHGTCRFLVQEDKPACVCHSGYVGTRCEHADLLAVVAANQKKQTITALVVVSVVASVLLIGVCVLIQGLTEPGGSRRRRPPPRRPAPGTSAASLLWFWSFFILFYCWFSPLLFFFFLYFPPLHTHAEDGKQAPRQETRSAAP
ncbi:protransforming growth factor alpha isoform X1 [Buteo buteo]|uniref:protransforming growth factor alpha isoform X1 n=1 Tax=Buteo buteo TaxID=30397 RepID=UPI003EBACD23